MLLITAKKVYGTPERYAQQESLEKMDAKKYKEDSRCFLKEMPTSLLYTQARLSHKRICNF